MRKKVWKITTSWEMCVCVCGFKESFNFVPHSLSFCLKNTYFWNTWKEFILVWIWSGMAICKVLILMKQQNFRSYSIESLELLCQRAFDFLIYNLKKKKATLILLINDILLNIKWKSFKEFNRPIFVVNVYCQFWCQF